MATDRMVVIDHADGRRFAVTPSDYANKAIDDDGNTYQKLGFKIEHWEDGEPYKPASKKSDKDTG